MFIIAALTAIVIVDVFCLSRYIDTIDVNGEPEHIMWSTDPKMIFQETFHTCAGAIKLPKSNCLRKTFSY